MIHELTANKPSFQSVTFTTGLNIVLAERSDDSSKKDTRNGLGKSTLVDIIDFCLGSEGDALKIPALRDWVFTLEITLATNRVKVSRAVANPNEVLILGPTQDWIEQPDVDAESGTKKFNLARWRGLLGWALLGLPLHDDVHKYKPRFRSLLSYFIRNGIDAYSDPFRHYKQQHTWDTQVHVAYLLGLNWESASELQNLRDQEEALKALEGAMKSGLLQDAWGSVGELESEKIQLEELLAREEEAVTSFRVHPRYEDIQREADQLTQAIHEIQNANVTARRKLTRYREALREEQAPVEGDLEKVFKEAGAVFADGARQSLEAARTFHRKIIENRKAFLETELRRLRDELAEREGRTQKLSERRAQALRVLQTHGALQEMVKLQQLASETRVRLERVTKRIEEIKDIVSRKRGLKTRKAELAKTTEADHEARRPVWSAATKSFNEVSHALYESPGKLIIDIGEAGYKFKVEIERSGSEGVGKMKLFCFDLLLLQSMRSQKRGIDFLIHDSILFDGVDPRQRALAIEVAHAVTIAARCQYICTLNSDALPVADFSEGFDYSKFVRLTLHDKDPSGRLLGIQFEAPSD